VGLATGATFEVVRPFLVLYLCFFSFEHYMMTFSFLPFLKESSFYLTSPDKGPIPAMMGIMSQVQFG
jgi:hypothetical protein